MSAKSILREMKCVTKYRADMISDADVTYWKVEVSVDHCPPSLASALKKGRCYRIVFGLKFDDEFPLSPPFMYVMEPTFVPMTGHVLHGGGICAKILTDSSWLPTIRVQHLVDSILNLMADGGPRVKCARSVYNEQDARESLKRAKVRYQW